ncbi:hypothetical protein [Amycolatopsis nigrescens]|uniref:hypothetical protein n=1 Tax=Amycolatopsis nigrescens TaxID=381445 RepID=UPI0003687955|nr:hypothetical protein [Amycolatopsis nigrescens]
MTERAKQGDEDDPTAQWLADIRPEETPWRTDRPAGEPEPAPGEPVPEKWQRTRKAARIAGQAAPYVQAAALAGWVASEALDDDGDDYQDGYGAGFDAGFDAGSAGYDGG